MRLRSFVVWALVLAAAFVFGYAVTKVFAPSVPAQQSPAPSAPIQ